MSEAKQSVRRDYGDDSGGTAVPTKSITEITTGDSNVGVTGRVLSVGKRSIQYSGERSVIFEGELADEGGKISYTAWEDFGLEPGETVQIGNAGVREWEGDPELNLGESTDIERVEESLSVPYDVGGEASLAELEPGDRGVAVEVSVRECEQRTIDGRDGETEILSGVVADESTRLPFTDWKPRPQVEEGTSVRIENAYIREFRGAPSVNISEFSTVTPLEESVAVTESAPHYDVREAVESGGLFDVELAGNVVGVRDRSGLIERCPECGRVVQSGQCRAHGAVEAEDDLRVKAILDDGTGTVTVVLDEERTAEIYGGGIDAAREHARDAMDREVVAESIRGELVGRAFRVRGALSVDDFGATLDATTFEADGTDPAEHAARLVEEVET
jgi:Single-stranded DNA-binding replication protein A (RPA), large (70 kD) subunit and related ssDNA-binding proteins